MPWRSCGDQNSRQRHRHSARRERKDVQSVLYDEARWGRNRPRPLHQPRHYRQAAWRVYRCRDDAWRVHRVSYHSSPQCRGHRQSRSINVNLLVLVVDDEPDVEMLFRQQFRHDLRAGRFIMEFARSGDKVLQRIADARDVSIILILSDINMPGMTGLEPLPKAKAARPDVPVIMITAYGDAETKRKALEGGAEALFTKPIDFGALRNEIDTRVQQAA